MKNLSPHELEELVSQDLRKLHIYPFLEGLVAAIIVFVSVCVSCWFIYVRALDALDTEIRSGLLQMTMAVGATIDGDGHQTLRSNAQKASPYYHTVIKPFTQIVAQHEEVKFAYTSILKDEKVYFILDPTPEGDADNDGVEDSVQIMEEYTEVPAELMETHRTEKPTVSEVYTDKWGTFISAYTPFYHTDGTVEGVFAMDVELSKYKQLLSPIRHATIRGLVVAGVLAFFIGVAVWFFRSFAQQINHSRRNLMEGLVSAMHLAKEKAREKASFLASMSHEIRTPLNAVIGFSNTLKQTSLSEEQYDHVETIAEAGEALVGVINEVLDLSKLEAGKVELHQQDCDLIKLVDTVVNLLSTQAYEKNIEIVSMIDPKTPAIIVADQGRLRQILINLLGNAIKFTDKGGVRLEVRPLADPSEHTHRLECRVIDTGMGIAPEAIDSIFSEFYQADKTVQTTHGGTGLGLSISQKLVTLMRGDITATSVPGELTTFTFTIEVGRSELMQAPMLTQQMAAKTLLLVDVPPLLTEAINKQCESLPITVSSCTHGALLSGDYAIHDLMLVDVDCEGCAEVLPSMRDKAQKLVVLAGQPLDEGLSLLCDQVVRKPIKQKMLMKLFSEVV